MSARVITYGIQKGGASKSVSCAVSSFILSHYEGAKVLVIDGDSQANISQLLTQKPSVEFDGYNIFDLIKDVQENPELSFEEIEEQYIVSIKEGLDLIPSGDSLSNLWRYIYTELDGEYQDIFKDVIAKLKDHYTHILIDSAPDLSERMIAVLNASTDVVIMYEPSVFCLTAVPKFVQTIEFVRESLNPELSIVGIAPSIIDDRRKENDIYLPQLRAMYQGLVFETIIKRKATTSRLSLHGLNEDNKELKDAIEPYVSWTEELLTRLEKEEVATI
jgi:chromosome partitioning protein